MVSYYPSPGLYPRPYLRESRDYMHSMYLCFCCHFWVIFFSQVDTTLLKRWAILQSAKFSDFILAGTAKYLVNVFICLFLVHSEDFHYYWHSGSCKEPHFMKSPTNGGFRWPGRSSSGVDPVVSSHTRPCGNFTGCTQKQKQKKKQNKKPKTKQQTEGGRKKQTNTDLKCKTREVKSDTFKHFVRICYG